MKSRRKKSAVKEEVFTVVDLDEFETVCQVCEAEFLDEADLKLHVAQMHSEESHGKIICAFCCAVLPGPQEYVSHFIFKHLERSFFCYYCYRVFSDSSLLDQHKMKHCVVADNSALTCSQCSTILINRQELQRHEFQEHMNSEDCFMLNHLFSLLSSTLCMKITKFIDSKCMEQQIVCRKCKYSSSSTKLYVKHLKASKCRCFTCDKCFNVYKKKPSIVIHMRRCYINAKKDVKKKCIKCKKYFDSKDLSAHKKSCKVIKCSACQKVFDTMNELSDHRELEHNARISLETCKFCKKPFVGALSLKKHMNRSHKDPSQYKYNCVHCDSRFNHPSKLFGHFFTRHKDIKPYTCKICNKCFRLRKQFTLHIKLEHKSIGFVEFDENLHVIFTDKKSENPIAPQANVGIDSSTDASDSDCNEPPAKRPMKRNAKQPECKENVPTTPLDATESTLSPKNQDSNKNLDNSNSLPANTVQVQIEPIEETGKDEIDERVNEKHNSPEELSDSSEDVPLSTMRKSIPQKNLISNIKRRTRDKKIKLTCKVCNKYCYTVQNFHHHMTLHEESTMKRCIKCNQYFRSKKELREHIDSSHISSQLIDTLKTVVEKRKKSHPVKSSESFRAVLERRRREQLVTDHNSAASKFRRTIRRVDISDNCMATMTPIMDEELSVKKFIENFKPEGEGLSISNSVMIKAMTTPVVKEPLIKMRAFTPESYPNSETKLRFPVRFKDSPASEAPKISVKLVQQLVTKPSAINMHYNEKIPLVVQDKTESDDYCNTFADETDYTEYKNDSIETDYTEYKNDSIPEVAQEVMLEDLEDIPQTTQTKQVAQEIIIPKIAEEHGEISIGHLLPQAPFFKIVKVKSLLNPGCEEEPDPIPKTDVQLPDGTRLVSVKNPYSHLIPNDHLQQILKANSNRTKYYSPKAKNIEKAIAKACEVKPPRKRGRKISKKDS